MPLAPNLGVCELAESVRSGERRAIARAITLVESRANQAASLLQALQVETQRGWRIGITGPPGAGKSTLTMQLVRALRTRGVKVGVIAVDPSSPFSHGALLGDRVRMNDVAGDEGVFIRSMASRGALGGLSVAAADAVEVLEAAGHLFVLIETVGVGQSEIDVARTADTTIVVLTPESGDEVQAAKAGVLEVSDIIVLNKCDRPGADASCAALRSMLEVRARDLSDGEWLSALVGTAATEGTGITELVAAIDAHRAFFQASPAWLMRRRELTRRRIRDLIAASLDGAFWTARRCDRLEESLEELVQGRTNLHSLVKEWVTEFQSGGPEPGADPVGAPITNVMTDAGGGS